MDDHSECFIVGMGASAGGLETFQKFFTSMPADSGLAFVLVQHLHPHHQSLMPELLSKSTDMPVLAAEEGMQIIPDHVYVIPSNTTLTVKDRRLHIEEPSESRGHRMPIDLFFKSLSEDCGERAICVVLTGTGSDGTLGLKAVKEHGGLAVAQSPQSAKYDSMPQNAIHTGLVDMVLDVQDMPQNILKFLDKSKVLRREIEEDGDVERHLDTIFSRLEERTQHEFTGYKRNTILRRIRRRMQILQVDSLAEYTEKVSSSKEEADLLFKDLLIGVTHFFRDAGSFEYLQERIIPTLLKRKMEEGDTSGLRVWVPGCATGEEAYTLALIIREETAKIKDSLPVQIFATDIDENALAVARRGIYPEGIEEQVPEKYLDRFFKKQGDSYQVNKVIREMCIFSPHNIISNPPYSRIDLLTCRNLLIYFDNNLQNKILPIFHYALKPKGCLFLGPSENISAKPELFRAKSKKHKIFEACENVPPAMIDFPLGNRLTNSLTQERKPFSENRQEREKVLARAFEHKVLEHYVPFSALLNDNADILYWAGPRAKFLDHPRGRPRSNLLEIVHKSLRLSLRSVLHKVISTGREVNQDNAVVETNEGLQRLSIHLAPFQEVGADSGLYFLVIREVGEPKTPSQCEPSDAQVSGEEVNRQLEEELKDTKSYLQSTIEELETSNEELKSSNEELLSMNEEMQSSNEELQTSKEELQSVNEELETVNTELKNKVQELDAANSDLHNLYESTQIATLFLDNELRIKAFTPAVTDLFRLIDSDTNRPIDDIVTRFSGSDLVREARSVLDKLEKRQMEITHRDTGNHYIMQMMPYRTVSNVIDGVTVSFVDITKLKRAKQELELRERMLRLMTDSVPVLISYVDAELKYSYCNSVYQDWFGLQEENIIGKTIKQVLGKKSFDELRPHIDKALAGDTVEFTATLNFLHDGEKIVSGRYEPHISDDGEVCGFISFIQDESVRILRERKLGRLAAIVNSTHEVIIGTTVDGVITDWNTGAERLYGYPAEEAVGRHIDFIVPEEKKEELNEAYLRLHREDAVAPFETVRLTKSGAKKHILLSLAAIRAERDENLGVSAVAHDISARMEAEDKLSELNRDLEQRVEERTRQLHGLTARFLSLEQRERRRFSQYLHDEIQQSLAAAKLLVEKAHSAIQQDNPPPPLSESLRLLSEAIKNTRTITMDLSPPLFFDSGMSVCLEWLARWAGAKLKLRVETGIEGNERPIAEEAGYLLYRSMREMLFNIHKHAGVDEAVLTADFKDDGGLEITVADEGRGFDPQEIPTRSTEHYGILSIVEQIRAMGGWVVIDSAVDRNTRIAMGLPSDVLLVSKKDQPADRDDDNDLYRQNREYMEKLGGEKNTILLVDDQEDLRYTLRLMLEELTDDYICLEAGGGEQAIEMAREYTPQLVLMDVSMPGMSGVEATRKIREEHDDIAVIGLSMHDREDMEKAMREAGADGYLTKDSSPEIILETIDTLLDRNAPEAGQAE